MITTVMTQREEPGPSSETVIAHTKQSEPNVRIVTRPWYVMVLVRVARVYVQSFVGLATADALTKIVDFNGVENVAMAALFPAFMSLMQNALEILTKMDTNESYSTFRA